MFPKEKIKNYSLSIIRLIALILILCCHIGEEIGYSVGKSSIYIFGNFCSVGVQIFLILSGYLYGQKKDLFKKKNRIIFLKENFIKILLDYYIALLFYFLIAYICKSGELSLQTVLGTITFSSFYGDTAHFWYIPYILFCYFLTSYLYDLREFGKGRELKLLIGIFVVTFIVCHFFAWYFNPAWISCYVLGYFLNNSEKNKQISKKHIACVICIVVVVNLAKYFVRYNWLPKIETGTLKYLLANYFIDYGRTFTAGVIFVVLLRFLEVTRKSNKCKKMLDLSDAYAYDIYLMHFIFVKGQLKLLFISENIIFNIILAIVVSVFSAVILHAICQNIKKILNKRRKNEVFYNNSVL